jgi:DNA-directed RNA polymerase subunit RPC12/RpoP
MYTAIMQIVIFITISLISGYIFDSNKLNFLIGVLFGCAMQFIFNYMYTSVLTASIALKNKKLENERIKEFTMQGMEVECPCSRKIRDFVPIRLNANNKYKCKECQKLITVFVTPSTALTTEPILDTDITNPNILKDANS